MHVQLNPSFWKPHDYNHEIFFPPSLMINKNFPICSSVNLLMWLPNYDIFLGRIIKAMRIYWTLILVLTHSLYFRWTRDRVFIRSSHCTIWGDSHLQNLPNSVQEWICYGQWLLCVPSSHVGQQWQGKIVNLYLAEKDPVVRSVNNS